MEVLQVFSELEAMLDLYRERTPDRVLEIGTWDGGTLREWLREEPELVVTIDNLHRNRSAYDHWRKSVTELVVGEGLSQSQEMADLMQEHAPYDWVFIDGDHNETAVQSDVDVALPLVRECGLVLLHDITPAAGHSATGPQAVFERMALTYEVSSIVRAPLDYPVTSAHGIGIIHT